jgi:hypothetical protein
MKGESKDMFWKSVTGGILAVLACAPAVQAAEKARDAGSAAIPRSGEYQYQLGNLHDWSTASAWCTRAHRTGQAWFSLALLKPRTVTGLGLVNGYARDAQSYNRNARARKIAVYIDDKLAGQFEVKDTAAAQWFPFAPVFGHRLKVVVKSVYKGARYDDLCVSEVVGRKRVVEIWNALAATHSKTGNRALKPDEVRQRYGALVDEASADNPDAEANVRDAIDLYTRHRGEAEIRMVLDVLYQCEHAEHLNAEFSEVVAGYLVPFFASNPQAVASVLKDETQLNRGELSDAYYTFIDPLGDEGEVEKYKDAHPAFRELSRLVDEFNRQHSDRQGT